MRNARPPTSRSASSTVFDAGVDYAIDDQPQKREISFASRRILKKESDVPRASSRSTPIDRNTGQQTNASRPSIRGCCNALNKFAQFDVAPVSANQISKASLSGRDLT